MVRLLPRLLLLAHTPFSPRPKSKKPTQRKKASPLVSSPLSPQNKQFYRDDHLFVDLRNRVVTLDSETLTLTSVEFRLLALLVQHAGEIVPRSILLTLTPTVDAHVWRLQKKLGKYAYQYIEEVGVVGYRFRPTPEH